MVGSDHVVSAATEPGLDAILADGNRGTELPRLAVRTGWFGCTEAVSELIGQQTVPAACGEKQLQVQIGTWGRCGRARIHLESDNGIGDCVLAQYRE